MISQISEHGNTKTFFRFLCSVVHKYSDKKVYMLKSIEERINGFEKWSNDIDKEKIKNICNLIVNL
ncbi:MAG: hypothetical protein FWG85_00785 [Bacteroidetes bacterium]|nr:hypothetical protein [Bacteroidota bacterium]